jgi:metal-dependent amidase/aminoacylase/carboxypeptidase family protein
VIPASVTLVGTVRSYDARVQDRIENRLRHLCTSIAEGFGAKARISYERVYPATINTAPEAAFAADVATSLVGAERVLRNMQPSMGGEDFSFMLQAKPGAYVRIGQQTEGSHPLHNHLYDFNDDVLPLGSAWFAGLIEQSLPLAD